MAVLSVRETFGYGARLLGYLLVTVLLGGLLVGGGVALAVTMDPAALPGGEAPASYTPVAVGGGLAAIGGLVIVTGLLATVFAMITDAVRVGIDRSSVGAGPGPDEPTTSSTGTSDSDDAAQPGGTVPDEAGEPSTTEPSAGEPSTAEPSTAEPSTTDPASAEPAEDPLAGGSSDPFETSSDPFDEPDTSDPLAGGGTEPAPSGQGPPGADSNDRRQAGPTREGDDDAWRREIEAKLEDEDERPTGKPE